MDYKAMAAAIRAERKAIWKQLGRPMMTEMWAPLAKTKWLIFRQPPYWDFTVEEFEERMTSQLKNIGFRNIKVRIQRTWFR